MNDLLAMPARAVSAAFLDLEMTGLDPTRDRVCEVAVVRADGTEVVAEYQALVDPPTRMTPGARKVHGITDEMLAGAPRFEQIAPEVAELTAASVIISHNVTHDLDFLHREFEAANAPFVPQARVDTLLMARRLFAFSRNNLHVVADSLGIRIDGAHRALSDARVTFAVWNRMLEILDPGGDVTVGELLGLIDALAPNSPLRLEQQKTLQLAFQRRLTVWIEYTSSDGQTTATVRREVAIWRLKLPHFQGWCYLRDGERVFRIDRVRSVEAGEREYAIPTFASRI